MDTFMFLFYKVYTILHREANRSRYKRTVKSKLSECESDLLNGMYAKGAHTKKSRLTLEFSEACNSVNLHSRQRSCEARSQLTAIRKAPCSHLIYTWNRRGKYSSQRSSHSSCSSEISKEYPIGVL